MRYLGQHFLKNKNIVKRIADLAELSKDDVVLEVGPGKGILTEELLMRVKKVVAVEKDKKLCEFLSNKFSDKIKEGKLVLVEGDILEISNFKFLISNGIPDFKPQIPNSSLRQNLMWWQESKIQNEDAKLKSCRDAKILPWQYFGSSYYNLKNYKIVANIPYYITSRFLKVFLEEIETRPRKMVLMAQKEVAERICETPPKSVLSVSVQVYGEPKIAFRVSARNFFPPPKVDSAVIVINEISKKFFSGINEKKFFNIVKTGFSKKRKILINNLAEELKIPKPEMEKVFKKCGIDNLSRAENLSLQDWKCLYRLLNH